MGLAPITTQFGKYYSALLDVRNFITEQKSFMSFFGIPQNQGETIFLLNATNVEATIIKKGIPIPAHTIERGLGTGTDKPLITEGKSTKVVRKIGLIEELGAITSDKLYELTATESPLKPKSVKERMREYALEIFKEISRRHIRTHEIFARESILNGTQPTILGNATASFLYDFYRDAAATITAAIGWNQAATGLPLRDIDLMIDQMKSKITKAGDMLLLGATAFNDMMLNDSVQAMQDKTKGFEFAKISNDNPVPNKPMMQRAIKNGWEGRGYVWTDKGRRVWLFTNNETFIDNYSSPGVNTEVASMPLEQAILLWSGARFDRIYGPPDRLPVTATEAKWYREMFGQGMERTNLPASEATTGVIDARMFFNDAYTGEGEKQVMLRTQSSAIYVPTMTDAIVKLIGIHT